MAVHIPLRHKLIAGNTMNSNLLIISKQDLESTVTEAVRNALHEYHSQCTVPQRTDDAFGDLDWLYTIYPDSISKATIKHKSAMGLIPGKFKLGRRVLYDKAIVLAWMHSQASPEVVTRLPKVKSHLRKNL